MPDDQAWTIRECAECGASVEMSKAIVIARYDMGNTRTEHELCGWDCVMRVGSRKIATRAREERAQQAAKEAAIAPADSRYTEGVASREVQPL